jgi:hypothetical protein
MPPPSTSLALRTEPDVNAEPERARPSIEPHPPTSSARERAREPEEQDAEGDRPSDLGSFLTSLSRPAESPAIRAHDRTHLEFAIDYKVPTEESAEYVWEAYLFAPESLRLDSRTYSKDDVYEDLQTYVRFAVPECAFHDLLGAPIAAVKSALAKDDVDAAMRELRLFACQVRASGEESRRRILDGLTSGEPAGRWTLAAERYVADARAVTSSLREALALADGRPDPLKTAIAWIDEDCSRLVEALVGSVALQLRKMKDEGVTLPEGLLEAAEDVAVCEARYRDTHGLEGVGRLGMSRRQIEQIEFRRHVLKRFTSSVLWLSPEVRRAATWVSELLNAVAAAVAMAFATAAALWNGVDTNGNFMRWALVAIIAYAFKDRIKALLQTRFAQVVARNFPDRSWTVRDRERKVTLGEMEERSGFVPYEKLPDDVLAVRRRTQRHAFEEQARPETVLFHKKTVTLQRDRIRAADPRFEALTEILRLDVRRWLVHTDDPKRRFVFADPDQGVLGAATAPRVYNIAVVFRLARVGAPPGESPWHRVRVVVSRKGIRRIDAIR